MFSCSLMFNVSPYLLSGLLIYQGRSDMPKTPPPGIPFGHTPLTYNYILFTLKIDIPPAGGRSAPPKPVKYHPRSHRRLDKLPPGANNVSQDL